MSQDSSNYERTNAKQRKRRSATDRKKASNAQRRKTLRETFARKEQERLAAEAAGQPVAERKNKGGRPRGDPRLLAARRSYDNKKSAPSAQPVLAQQQQTQASAPAIATPPAASTKTGPKDYCALAEAYALDVVAGKQLANKWVKLSCKRFVDDLARISDASYPYYFDVAEANKKAALIEKFPHIKGRWAAQKMLLKLERWQCFLVCNVFGWRKKTTKKRRFRKCYWRIPRKNAKSTLAAAIGNVMAFADDEFGSEVYSGATSEKQAWEVFGPASLMMQRSPELVRDWGVEVRARAMVKTMDASKFWPIIGKPGDGSSPHCSITDEYHEHPTSEQVDSMQTGMAAREQPLSLIITTAGTNLASPCHDEDEAAQKMLLGVYEDDLLFAVLYGIDEGQGKPGEPDYLAPDDWADPKSLEKANPNIDVSADRDYLIAQQREAILNPAKQNRFKTKHLNVWCGASVAGINMHLWKLATDAGLSLDEFKGTECIGSLDLASKIDICDYVKLFWKFLDGKRHYYVFARHYLPEDTINDTERKQNKDAYKKWVQMGRLVPTEGAEIDFDGIRDDVKLDKDRFQFREIVYDPWRATQLAQQLQTDGATVVEIAQNVKNLGAAFDELNSALKGGRFHHDGDPVLEWMASNVVARVVTKGLTVPGKEKPENKIDGIVATVMAISRAMLIEDAAGGFDSFLRNPIVVG